MTPAGAEDLCTSAYAALMGPNPQEWSVCWYPVTHWTTGSVRSDDAYKGGGGTGDGWETHRLETFTLDATDGVTDSKWYHLCVSIQGPYKGDGFFLPSQDLINAYQTDDDGLPVFDYQSLPDFAKVTLEGDKSVITNYDHKVDPRLDFIVGRPNVTWKTYDKSPCLSQWVRDRGTYGYNCNKRFVVSPESPDMYPGWPWGASALNWHMIRYAHILLWEAEARIELGEVPEGIKLINQVRERARDSKYVKAWTDPSKCFDGTCPNFGGYAANYKIGLYPETLSKEQARQALRTETRLECAMEGERFFDLVRWGIAADVMNKYIAKEEASRVYYQGAQFTSGRDEYLPITNNQYKFSGKNYVQNPGYAAF